MAWYNRIPGVKQVVKAVNRFNQSFRRGGAPEPPPRAPVQPSTQRYWLPEPVVQPSPAGEWYVWDTEDEDVSEPYEPVYGGYEPVYDDSPLYGGEPDDTVTLYDQNGQPITYDKVYGTEVHFTGDQWYREAFRSQEDLLQRYGIDNIDILMALYNQGYINDQDWEYWREIYGGMFH